MGVVVQQMVAAEAAGVLFTLDPVNGDRSKIVIESSWGVGRGRRLRRGDPDRFAVDKVTLEIRPRTVSAKHVAYRFDPGPARCVSSASRRASSGSCSPTRRPWSSRRWASGRARAGARRTSSGRSAARGPREVYLLQTRPETVWSQRPR